MSAFRQALADDSFLFFDGGMGTMLQGAGLPAGASPEEFCMRNPSVLAGIHAQYVQAGADVLTTCTFGGSPFKLPPGLDVFAFNKRMAEVARAAAEGCGRRVHIAGDIGPSGHFARPLGDVEPVDMVAGFREQVRGLLAGGVDTFIVETQFDLAEARAAVAAIRQECDLPVMVSMTFEQGVSLTGSTPEIFAETMQNMGVAALGTNCSAGPEQMAPVVEALLAHSRVPVLAEPNAGLPELRDGSTVFRLGAEDFAVRTAAFGAAGVKLLGGCCGTTPAHIAALRRLLEGRRWVRPVCPVRGGVTLTTRSALVRIQQDEPLAIIGERINPTGKKQLTAELQAGEFAQALRFADEQVAAGAALLDVNVGAPLVDETVLLPELTMRLTGRMQTPLSLDSSNIDAIRRALPYCPGSPLVNSVSGEAGRMEALGPLCRDWGAPFILLPLRGKKLPVMASERIAILESLLEQAAALGIPRRLMMVDVLALAVSSRGEAGRQCLETIRWCVREGLATTLGLSNVSFGLPARELLNATYLGLCMGAGLTSCIANPSNRRLREARDAACALLNKDADAASFIAGYADWTAGSGAEGGTGGVVTRQERRAAATLYDAVLHGDRENVVRLVEQELDAGAAPFALVQEKLIPAITEVGRKYEKREYFLPQLIRAAETMQTAFSRLKPLLEENAGDTASRPVIVMATVEGDIHDIGKNIVSLLLMNHGFEVVDAGKDVPAARIVRCAEEHRASIIGLSALMTTTMVRMTDTVKLVRERGLPIRVMVGGAVVTQDFADSIGADGYAADAVAAVRTAQWLLGVS
ncbi:MAG: homocysteine S-methyltransferase family protein [Desulfovibrionaceae bacterium]|nr:homocysteine S-methyltransferase family protein [Desulfovibrionaceae bacterium]